MQRISRTPASFRCPTPPLSLLERNLLQSALLGGEEELIQSANGLATQVLNVEYEINRPQSLEKETQGNGRRPSRR